MQQLHIVQGGVENGDKDWLEKAARLARKNAPKWIVPKRAAIGDDVVVYVGGYGFFATARIASEAKPRLDWANRYGARLEAIRLIEPPISLSAIRRHLPELKWGIYPRSIVTPEPEVANQVRALIRERRKTGMPDLDDEALENANEEELWVAALLGAKRPVKGVRREVIYRARSTAIHRLVLLLAKGHCEACGAAAPFLRSDGSPYLEPHHTVGMAAKTHERPDHPHKGIALYPNFHRRAHHAEDASNFNQSLIRKLMRLRQRNN